MVPKWIASGITWELVRNANFQFPRSTKEESLGVGIAISVLISLQEDSDAYRSWKHCSRESLWMLFRLPFSYRGSQQLTGWVELRAILSFSLPTFFNLSLNLAIRSSWSEPQSAPSLVCWLCRVSPSLAAKNIINLISVLTIRWCLCVESSPVLPFVPQCLYGWALLLTDYCALKFQGPCCHAHCWRFTDFSRGLPWWLR